MRLWGKGIQVESDTLTASSFMTSWVSVVHSCSLTPSVENAVRDLQNELIK